MSVMRCIASAVALAATSAATLLSGCGDTSPADATPPNGRTSDPTSGPGTAPPSTQVGFVDRTLVESGVTYGYKVFVPRAYTPTKQWPVILFMHGSGEVGTDNVKQTQVGIGPAIRAQEATFPAIVVFPQLPSVSGNRLLFQRLGDEALTRTMREFNVDSTRIYQTGVSMGALWGWELALKYPTRLAALVPISGGICVICVAGTLPADSMAVYRSVARQLITVPVWFIHGDADASDPVTPTREAVQAFREVGAPVRYTEYRGLGHQATWDKAYESPDFFAWLLAQHR